MAYEVTKVVNGRPYRYRVRSERNAATGAFRNRWTYLGRADAVGGAPAVRPRRNAREALLDAVERLFARSEPDEVTAAAISSEAGVAHGTFYRYFRNKNDAIVALLDRIQADRPSGMDALSSIPAERGAARESLRAWAGMLLRKPERHGAVMRALYVLSSHDDGVLAIRQRRRAAFVGRLSAYLTILAERGFTRTSAPLETAHVLSAMLDGLFREAILDRALDDARIAAAVDLIEAAVFGLAD